MKQVTAAFFRGNDFYPSGKVVADNDPVVAACPDSFRDLVLDGPVEQATAAPGEKRTTKRPEA